MTPRARSCLVALSIGCAPPDVEEPTVGDAGLQVVAGLPGRAGFGEDGLPAAATMLFLPQDMTPGPDGTWWVVDYNNHVVREVGADGVASVVLGSGWPGGADGGPALEEPLDHPTVVLPDPSAPEVLWVAATGNHRIARLADGYVAFPYGTGEAGYCGDGGPAAEACFWRPSSLAFDDTGAMYVSDRMNHIVRRIADDRIETVAGTPEVPGYAGDGGPAAEALLYGVIETDPGNRLDVRGRRLVLADTGNHAVREVDLDTGLIRTLAGTGEPSVDTLDAPKDVAIAADGTVYVADTGNACVRAVGLDGESRVVAGRCGEPGPALDRVDPLEATLQIPAGVAVSDEWLWIADTGNHVIRRMPLP